LSDEPDILSNPEIVKRAVAIVNGFSGLEHKHTENEDKVADTEGQVAGIDQRIRSIPDYIGQHGASAPAAMMDDIRTLEADK
jgi:hypothetical protein